MIKMETIVRCQSNGLKLCCYLYSAGISLLDLILNMNMFSVYCLILPGQVLQSLVLNISPVQFSPPFLGPGMVHSLRLVSTPRPQVLPEVWHWQGLQEFHSVQPPGSEVLRKLSSSKDFTKDDQFSAL